MKIICAGFPKTGTKSMARALTELGYNVHDFEEHLEYNLDNYIKFFDGDLGEEMFLDMYRDVDVVVDQPASTLWYILHQQFPEAKIILMERDSAEDWFRSYYTMIQSYRLQHDSWLLPLYSALSNTHYKLEKLSMYNMMLSTASESALRKKVCKGRFQSVWMDQYRRHNAAVKALVPAPDLLVYRVGEGWERLCQFLQLEVPAVPFPHENKAGQAGNIVEKYLNFTIFKRAETEVRRSLLTVSLTVSATIIAGWFLSKSLRFSMK